MELYVLDAQLRRIEVFDQFESFIWTDRFDVFGDFEFLISPTPLARKMLIEGAHLANNESQRVMVIETSLDDVTSEGKAALKVTGRSIELILDQRIARNNMSGLDANPRWALTGTPGAVARKVFKDICIDGILSVHDKIPFITTGSIFPVSNIPEPSSTIKVEFEPDTVYNIIQNICSTYGLGFALVRNADLSQLYFEIYTGRNKTSLQSTYKPLIFSPDLDTLANTSEFVSIENYKNVAYVFSNTESVMVYADGVDPTVAGFNRRVLMVKVDDVKPTADENGLTTAQILTKRGKDELLKYKRISAFDGEIPKTGYKHGVDYDLGDIVEMQKSIGTTKKFMRITEQIFVSDAEGDRSYPTLSDVVI